MNEVEPHVGNQRTRDVHAFDPSELSGSAKQVVLSAVKQAIGMVPIAGDVFAVVERVEDDRRERFFDETVRRLGTDVQTLAMLADDGSLAELLAAWMQGSRSSPDAGEGPPSGRRGGRRAGR